MKLTDDRLIAFVKRGSLAAIDHRPKEVEAAQAEMVITNHAVIKATGKGERTLQHDFVGLDRDEKGIQRGEDLQHPFGIDCSGQIVEDNLRMIIALQLSRRLLKGIGRRAADDRPEFPIGSLELTGDHQFVIIAQIEDLQLAGALIVDRPLRIVAVDNQHVPLQGVVEMAGKQNGEG